MHPGTTALGSLRQEDEELKTQLEGEFKAWVA